MLRLLVVVDRNLEASFALRTACLLGPDHHICPVHASEPPGRDMAFGAGWARRSWERETNRQIEEDLCDLIRAERTRCPHIQDPVVSSGDPFVGASDLFRSGSYDLLIFGAPYRGNGPLGLCRRLSNAAKREGRALPVLIVRHLTRLENIVVLTDGSDLCENAMDLLLKTDVVGTAKITLTGITNSPSQDSAVEDLNVARSLAIFAERGRSPDSFTASSFENGRLSNLLKSADLLVNPIQQRDPYAFFCSLQDDDIHAMLAFVSP